MSTPTARCCPARLSGLKKYKHLVGNYGGAWQNQAKEFEAFPGAILMTTNCIQKPREATKAGSSPADWWPGRACSTSGPTGLHASDRSGAGAPGFTEDAPAKTIIVGFGRNAVLGVADKVIDAVKAGKIRHFFLVGGCDGAKAGRNYFTELRRSCPTIA